MRVTHVITRLIVGGAQENTVASVLGLREKADVGVQLISGPTAGPEGSLEPSVAGIAGLLTVVPELVRPVNPWKDAIAWRALVRLFREQQPDLVHTHSGKAGILGRFAARSASVRVIVHSIHGPSFGPFQGPASNALFKAAERAAGRFTTHFVSVADAMTRQYLEAGIGTPDQYSRIFSGFDLGPYLASSNDPALRAQFGLAPSHFVIGKIARLFALKGHDDLIDAAAALAPECPNARFLLVGDGKWRERLEGRVRLLGLRDRFVFAGLVPPVEVPRLVGIMDALVHLSRREGLPRALPQALAAGKPVIAYDCDGASEVCLDGRTGFLVEPGDVPALTKRVLQLARDPELGSRLGEAGQRLVRERFTVEKMVEDLYAVYGRLLAGAGG